MLPATALGRYFPGLFLTRDCHNLTGIMTHSFHVETYSRSFNFFFAMGLERSPHGRDLVGLRMLFFFPPLSQLNLLFLNFTCLNQKGSFERLHDIVNYAHNNSVIDLSKSIKQWKLLRSKQKWFRCLSVIYLIEKSIYLGRYKKKRKRRKEID